jgi:diaminopimelate epimerase
MISIHKLTGAGNHFLFIDLRELSEKEAFVKYCDHFSKVIGRSPRGSNRRGARSKKQTQLSLERQAKLRPQLAQFLCNPYFSIGADGLLFLENAKAADLKWDFYNADGSTAEMCGNAARCVGAYLAHVDPYMKSPIRLETTASDILITVLAKQSTDGTRLVCAEMPKVSVAVIDHKKNHVTCSKRTCRFDFVNSGVPHAVFDMTGLTKDLRKIVDKLEDIVHKTRALMQFKHSSTNVTFFIKKKRGYIESLTFERGVKGYTQACGTGATAAAYSYSRGAHDYVTVEVPGGQLGIDLTHQRPLLIGPARYIAEIRLAAPSSEKR